MARDPRTQLDAAYSSPEATATPWAKARRVLERAGCSGYPPSGPTAARTSLRWWPSGWTGPSTSRRAQRRSKAKNLARNARCLLTTGSNDFGKGLDVVVEGKAAVVTDEPLLRRLAALYDRKYDDTWNFEVRDGAFHHEAGRALVFRLTPRKAFSYGRGLGRGKKYTATRYRFSPSARAGMVGQRPVRRQAS
jgi:hypothetical protein